MMRAILLRHRVTKEETRADAARVSVYRG